MQEIFLSAVENVAECSTKDAPTKVVLKAKTGIKVHGTVHNASLAMKELTFTPLVLPKMVHLHPTLLEFIVALHSQPPFLCHIDHLCYRKIPPS